MKNYTESAIVALISGVVLFLLNITIGLFTMPSGVVLINESIKIDQENYYCTVDLINYENDIFEDINIDVPGDIIEITTSNNIDYNIKKFDSSKGSSIYIERYPEKLHTKIIIKYSSINRFDVTISNLKNNNISLKTYDNYANPKKEIILNATVTAVIYSIMFSIFYHFETKRKSKLKSEISKLEKNHNEQTTRIEKIEETAKNIHNTNLKRKMLYISRLTEYKKENEFWKNIMKSMINKELNQDKLFKLVADNLKTYSTLSKNNSNEIEYLEMLTIIEKGTSDK